MADLVVTPEIPAKGTEPAKPPAPVALTPEQKAEAQSVAQAEIAKAAQAKEEAKAAKIKAKADADAAAEAAKNDPIKAKLAELEASNKALKDQLTAADVEAATAHRIAALDRAGVKAQYREDAPKLDPRKPDEAKKLDDWIKARPEIVSIAGGVKTVEAPAYSQKVLDIQSGKVKSPYLTPASMQAMRDVNGL